MVDISLNIQTLTAEVIRRAVIGWLPGIAIKETRVVAAVACSRNINEALPKLKTRLDGLPKKASKSWLSSLTTICSNTVSTPPFNLNRKPPNDRAAPPQLCGLQGIDHP